VMAVRLFTHRVTVMAVRLFTHRVSVMAVRLFTHRVTVMAVRLLSLLVVVIKYSSARMSTNHVCSQTRESNIICHALQETRLCVKKHCSSAMSCTQCQCQVWIYIARLCMARKTLVSLVLHEEMSLQRRLKGIRTQRQVTEVSW